MCKMVEYIVMCCLLLVVVVLVVVVRVEFVLGFGEVLEIDCVLGWFFMCNLDFCEGVCV